MTGGLVLVTGRQPATKRRVQRVSVQAGQDTAHGRLIGWPIGPAHRIVAHPRRGQDCLGRILGPLPDRSHRPGAGQHRGHRDGQHTDQRVASTASGSGIGELGEVGKQAGTLVGAERNGRVQAAGEGRDG